MSEPAAANGRRGWRARLDLAFLRMTRLSLASGENYLLLVAIGIGVLAGLGAAVFHQALEGMHQLFFVGLVGTMAAIGPSAVIFLPAIGGLIVGPLIRLFAPEARGHGVPEVMTAVATRGGRIQGRVAVVKIIASAISIGSGGSAGQEGPMVQIGAASASALGQRLRVPPEHMRTIVACGAAGGLSAVFNAPVGGAIFALEVITGQLTPAFGAVILSSVSATAVSRGIFGNYPSFVVPRYELVSNAELLLYALLGVAAGLTSVAFIRTLYWFERAFDGWSFPPHLKPVVGGLLVGLIGRFAPGVFGTGTDTIEAAVWDRHVPLMLAALVPLKILATSLTLGSGGSGGVFGPSMFVGAMLGGSFGWAAHLLAPGWTAGSGAYALVGIGAVVGGTALAPLTSIILLFEMTDDYRIILPVMEATVIAIVVTRAFVGESIYTLKLKESNIAYYAGREIEQLRAYTVRDVMRFEVEPVDPSTSVAGALALATRRRLPALIVGTPDAVVGVVTLEELARAITDEPRPERVADVMTDLARTRIVADASLETALLRLNETDSTALVVVSEHDGHPLGIVARSDLLRTYQRVLHRTAG